MFRLALTIFLFLSPSFDTTIWKLTIVQAEDNSLKWRRCRKNWRRNKTKRGMITLLFYEMRYKKAKRKKSMSDREREKTWRKYDFFTPKNLGQMFVAERMCGGGEKANNNTKNRFILTKRIQFQRKKATTTTTSTDHHSLIRFDLMRGIERTGKREEDDAENQKSEDRN